MTQQEAIDSLLRGANNTTASIFAVNRDTLLVALGAKPGIEEAEPTKKKSPPVATNPKRNQAVEQTPANKKGRKPNDDGKKPDKHASGDSQVS